jgi:hypothetical protein
MYVQQYTFIVWDQGTDTEKQLVTQNHDAQVRFKWSKNDLAIWDNRSTWHCATYDYAEARAGDRVCSLGEAPYLDLQSKSRKEALRSG